MALSWVTVAWSAAISASLTLALVNLLVWVWFRILRKRGVKVSYGQYIRLGVPVTLAAIVIAILALNLQRALVLG